MPDLFLSHATKDDVDVDRIASLLAERGLTVWIDHQNGIMPGNPNWDRAIRGALQESTAGVLIMSPRALASDVCAAECLLVRELGRPLYVAYLDTCKPEEIWLTIKMIQYADLRADMPAGIDKLAAAIRGTPGTDHPTAVVGKLTGSDVMRANLPYLSTVPLIGRDADLEKIRAGLGAWVMQLIAVGGTGKSRIAAEIALGYASGAIWHRCGETSAAYQVTDGIRQHFRLDEKLKEDEVLAALDGGTPPLIVVDNAETVAAGTPERTAYVTLLNKLIAHKVPVLLTARVVWDELKPRRECPLQPITPEAAAKVALQFASAEDVPLSTADAADLADACRQHPRLIEFAVRQLHERDAQKVIRQVRELKHPDIQEALAEMILQTVRQMAEQAKNGSQAAALLACLTVMRGTFDSAAVMALKPADMDDDTADDALVTLQRWGFVARDPSGVLRIDQVVSGAVPPTDESAARHFAYYLSLHGDFEANNDEDRHPQIEADWPNIRAALDWGFAAQPEPAVDWVSALSYFMQMRLSRAEWRAVMTVVLDAANRIGYVKGQANMRHSLAHISYLESDYPGARAAYEAAMPLYEAIGDQTGQAYTLQRLGDVMWMQSDYASARAAYEAAMPLFQEIDDLLGQANTQKGLGDVALTQGDYAAARAAYEAAMALYQDTGDRLGQANTQKGLGDVARMQSDYAAARTAYEAAMALYQDTGDRLGQANTLQRLGDITCLQGDYAAARAAYEAAMPLYQDTGDRVGQANTQKGLGDVARMQNDYPAARAAYQQALTLGSEIGEFISRLNSLYGLVRVEQADDNRDPACEYYQQLMALAESHPFFAHHPIIESWRKQFADLGCEPDPGDQSPI